MSESPMNQTDVDDLNKMYAQEQIYTVEQVTSILEEVRGDINLRLAAVELATKRSPEDLISTAREIYAFLVETPRSQVTDVNEVQL